MNRSITQLTFTCSKSTKEKLEKIVTCSKLTIKTPERRHWRRFVVFIVNFEHILHLFPVFLLLTLKQHGTIIGTYYSSMEAVNVSWILCAIINHGSVIYSLAQNICRLFFVLAQCLFARSET